MFNRQGVKAHKNVLMWLSISAVSRECNSTTELTFDVNICRIVHYIEPEAPELQLIECTL